MRGLLVVLRRGWRSLRPPAGPPVPFEVVCPCGQVQRGLRTARAQIIRCPGCGEAVFLLPRSPLPPPPDEAVAAAEAESKRGRSPWLLPLAAAVGTLVAVVMLYIVLFSSWLRPSAAPDEPTANSEALPRGNNEAGRRLLQEGNFREALKQLDAAGASRDPALRQLYRQADLLARLLHQPLEEIVQQGQMLGRPGEWQEQFKDYKGRAVLFDDVVRRDENGQFHLSVYEVLAGDEKATVRLDLELLRHLPLDQPRRLLFGARLASVQREDGGFWVIRFEPDSGVLLTDEGAAAACGVGPLDAGLRHVVQWQADWLRQPGVSP